MNFHEVFADLYSFLFGKMAKMAKKPKLWFLGLVPVLGHVALKEIANYPLAHHAKRGARVLISTCVEFFYMRGD